MPVECSRAMPFGNDASLTLHTFDNGMVHLNLVFAKTKWLEIRSLTDADNSIYVQADLDSLRNLKTQVDYLLSINSEDK